MIILIRSWTLRHLWHNNGTVDIIMFTITDNTGVWISWHLIFFATAFDLDAPLTLTPPYYPSNEIILSGSQ
jgi:hypothetical protein